MEGANTVVSLSFWDMGDRMLVARADGHVDLYDTLEGKHVCQVDLSPWGGVQLVRCTHGKNKFLFSSPERSRVGYFDLAENKLLYSFEGHAKRCVSSPGSFQAMALLCASPSVPSAGAVELSSLCF